MNEGRFWAWRPWSQAQSGDVSLHPPCADTACKYTAWQMAWLCSSPPTNLWQAGLMPERLADRPCLIHCHKRHIVYRTERHCNTNTNTLEWVTHWENPWFVAPVLASRRTLQWGVCCSSLLKSVCYTVCPSCISCWSVTLLCPDIMLALHSPCSGYIRHSLAVHFWLPPNMCVWL